MTDAEKLDKAERIARRCEEHASNMAASLDNIEHCLDDIRGGLHRCQAHVSGMDRALGRIGAGTAMLQDSVPRLPSVAALLWYALAGALALLVVSAVGQSE